MPKHLVAYFLGVAVVALGIVFFAMFESSSRQTANIADALPTPEPLCENSEAIEDFETPIPIVWTAKMDGCLAGCEGASFTRIPLDEEYPRFVGYSPELLKIEPGESILEISGDWIGVSADHPVTVFNDKCVPIVEIKSINPFNNGGED